MSSFDKKGGSFDKKGGSFDKKTRIHPLWSIKSGGDFCKTGEIWETGGTGETGGNRKW